MLSTLNVGIRFLIVFYATFIWKVSIEIFIFLVAITSAHLHKVIIFRLVHADAKGLCVLVSYFYCKTFLKCKLTITGHELDFMFIISNKCNNIVMLDTPTNKSRYTTKEDSLGIE